MTYLKAFAMESTWSHPKDKSLVLAEGWRRYLGNVRKGIGGQDGELL